MSEPTTSQQLRSQVSGCLGEWGDEFDLDEILAESDDGGVRLNFMSEEFMVQVTEGDPEDDGDPHDYVSVFLTLPDAKALQAQLDALVGAIESTRRSRRA